MYKKIFSQQSNTNYQYYFKELFLGLLFMFYSVSSVSCIDVEEQMKVFYKYDELMNIKAEDRVEFYGVEKGFVRDEIFCIEGISSQYQVDIRKYLDAINEILKENITDIETYYESFLIDDFYNFPPTYDDITKKAYPETIENCQLFQKMLKEDILDHFLNAIRVMYNIKEYQFILVGKEIEQGVYASTVEWPNFNNTLWSKYNFDLAYSLNPDYETEFVNKNGEMKFPYWFYETNLKIRIVKQIRSKNGKYLGEIAVDFYKLKDFNKLFLDYGEKE